VEPPVLASTDGLLQTRLEAAPGPVRIAGRRANALSYNGALPGPTLHLQPGDRLRVQLVNRLNDPTNLHVHGLHVSPEGNGDNAFVTVKPGASFDYDYQLPPNHPPGVYWYHPHHHGTVADQIFGGLYGAIIVSDPVRGSGQLPVTRERVVVISDITLNAAGSIRFPSAMARMRGREGDLVLVNGQARPILSAQAGERERWRIVNACTARYLRLRLQGQRLELLGLDSGRFAAPRDVTEVVLASGNRADLLVTTAPGTSRLQAMPYDRGDLMGMGSGGMRNDPQARSNPGGTLLATLDVTGGGVTPPPPIPAEAEPRDLRQESVARGRQLTFAIAMGGGTMRFIIDGKEFDPNRIDQTVAVGTIEEWVITTRPRWTTRSTSTFGLCNLSRRTPAAHGALLARRGQRPRTQQRQGAHRLRGLHRPHRLSLPHTRP
jgi:FtsP/CotA-like multicopper oxidase with cupredoxin domain